LQSGLVVKEQSGFFWVEVEVANGETRETSESVIYRCRLRGRLLEEARSSDVAAIGDRVKITILEDDEEGDKGVIEEVEERTSVLSRAARTEGNRGGGEALREHVIVANADQAVFVFAAAQPTPSLSMLDRFLAAGEKSEIEDLIIVVNKIDLEDPGNISARFGTYERMGYTVLHTSARMGTGIDELRALLKGKLSVFTGPSGVGKTSLLNKIQPGLGRAVKEVSGYHQEGQHTTRDSALIKLDEGGYIADTPGMRNITLWDVEPEELDGYFIDIAPLVSECRFGDCTHLNEPGCAVVKAVNDGRVARSRHKNYLKLREELEAAYAIY
jgi:ribosome biogenesis GTPase